MQQKNFGNFLRQKRINKMSGLSLNDFAMNNDIEPATLSRIERSLQDIKFSTMQKIANGLNMKTSELIAEYEAYKIELQN